MTPGEMQAIYERAGVVFHRRAHVVRKEWENNPTRELHTELIKSLKAELS